MIFWYYLGDSVTFIIYLYYLSSTPLGDFSSWITKIIRCIVHKFYPFQFESHLNDWLLFQFILLCHIHVDYTNIYFCEWLNFNTLSRTFIYCTIVIFTWYDFTPYYIVLPTSISDWYFQPGSICFWCIIYVITYITHKGFPSFKYCVRCLNVLFVQ